MEVAQRLRDAADRLTVAERRIAEVILADPSEIGFGTVAQLAAAADAGAATVVRLATKLGYDGYAGLQASVRRDLAGQLRPAAERIREETLQGSLAERHAAVEIDNVRASVTATDEPTRASVVALLADERSDVVVVSGSASSGVARQFAADLGQLRPGVTMLDGNEVERLRQLALAAPDSVLVAVDLRRYERWLLDTVRIANCGGARVVAVTDSVISPLTVDAAAVLVVRADAVGPFDSHVGTLALFNLLVAETATLLRGRASARLDAIEQAWTDRGALID